MNLPPLRGTPAQIKWAATIRTNALDNHAMRLPGDQLASIDDATWWIGNRDKIANDTLAWPFKAPAPHQLAGGPPPPGNTPDLPVQGRKPHDAELFAASVSRHPVLAEIALIALLARCYKGDMRDQMRQRAADMLKDVRAETQAALDRDMDGIHRILASLRP